MLFRSAVKPASAAMYLAAFASAPQSFFWSYFQAARIAISQAASSSIHDCASGCWMAWFWPIGRSKTMRSFA